MTYEYKYKHFKSYFWKTAKKLKGHNLNNEGKMIFFHEDGSQTIISNWKDYDAKLGTDFFLWTKQELKKESGLEIS